MRPSRATRPYSTIPLYHGKLSPKCSQKSLHSSPVRASYEVSLWIQSIIYVTSLTWINGINVQYSTYAQYRVLTNRVITGLDCIWIVNVVSGWVRFSPVEWEEVRRTLSVGYPENTWVSRVCWCARLPACGRRVPAFAYCRQACSSGPARQYSVTSSKRPTFCRRHFHWLSVTDIAFCPKQNLHTLMIWVHSADITVRFLSTLEQGLSQCNIFSH